MVKFDKEDCMTRFEYLAVLRSMDLALKNGTKEDVEKLIAALIRDAEIDPKSKKK